MKAMAQNEYGSVEVLRLAEVDRPAAGAGEVLIEVRAAGLDPGVWHLMSGRPYLVRAMGFGLTRPKVPVRGRDLAGVVVEVGPDVTGFQPGDEVYGTCESGSFAEYATARAGRLAVKPAALSFQQAAVAPISGVTALQAVRDAGHVQAGQRVLVIGAAGGVGSFAVQIAVARGATVTGVCSAGKASLVHSLGAAEVIDYAREEIDRDPGCFDVIIDTAGNRPLRVLRRALTARGIAVLVGGEHGRGSILGGFDRQLRAPLSSMFGGQRLRALMAKENAADLDQLSELISSGAVSPVIDHEYPLEQVPDAIEHLHQGHAAGKIVITV
jgi:NADPH:quinone reductase-like Zn-dependent oxidoreductase